MKDIVAKITGIWEGMKDYLQAFIDNFLGAKDSDLLAKIKDLISNILGTAKDVADAVEEEE